MKPKLSISFSGGRTSAVMTKLLLDERRDTHDIRVTFANTGCEHHDTLRFVNDCDKEWDFNVVWLEAVVTHGERVGIRHKIVSYETASRSGEPFEEYIKKYGVPNTGSPQCTSRLKTEVMESYLRAQGFIRGKSINYDTAIGIRADEIDRISARRDEYRFVYPLVQKGWTKEMVINYMKQFSFDLRIPEHLGNCTWCWKKTDRKLYTLALDNPEVFEFPRRMESKYGSLKAKNSDGERRFFRRRRSTDDIVAEAMVANFIKFTDPNFDPDLEFDPDIDIQSGCGESCEVYPTNGE